MMMNTLERALIEKAGYEHGWEYVIESQEASVILASARHRAQVRIMPQMTGKCWIIEVPPGLLRQELIRSLPETAQVNGDLTAADMDQLVRLLRRAAELSQSLPNQAALTFAARVQDVLKKTLINTTEVERLVKHPVYQKYIRRKAKFMAHDEGNECRIGDRVLLTETRPLSKQKRFKVSKVLEKME